MEYKKKLVADKLGQMDLSLLPSSQQQEYSDFKHQYTDYLETCNMTDHMDILSCIKDEIPKNSILKETIEKSNFIITNYSGSEVETEMVRLLADGKKVLSANMALSLEISILESDNIDDLSCDILVEETSLTEALIKVDKRSPPISVTERYVEKVLHV